MDLIEVSLATNTAVADRKAAIDQGHRDLAGAVFAQAVLDLHDRSARLRNAARVFLKSPRRALDRAIWLSVLPDEVDFQVAALPA